MRRKKVALMTIFQVPNYGSVLQAYASLRVLSLLGHDSTIINYRYPNSWHYGRGWKHPGLISRLKERVGRMLNIRNGKVQNSLEDFRKKHLHLTQKFADYDALLSHDWRDTVLISGSDQIWNARYLYGDKAFLLGFAPENIRKVSMASSFAAKEIAHEYTAKYRELLGQYAALSVRETNGVHIINSQLGIKREARVMLDPTLLLPFKEWCDLAVQPAESRKRFVLLYELTYSFRVDDYLAKAAQAMKKRYECEQIISFGDLDHIPGTISRRGCSVGEFISLFRDATVVVTNSFHGTAFAVNAARPLVAVTPGTDDDRQSTLLTALGINHCAVTTDTPIDRLNPEYDKAAVEARLNDLRQADLEWLATALG